MAWRTLFFLIGCLLMNGCHAPRFSPPQVSAPCQWKRCSEVPCPPIVENWWEIFQDGCLSSLELQAVGNNPDVYIAFSKICEARAIAGVKNADAFPQLVLDPHYLNQGILFKIFGIDPGVIPGLPSDVFRIHRLDYYFPFDMSYEIDLWGRIRKQILSAKLDAQAAVLDFHGVLLAITTDLASFYFNIRTLDAQIAFFQQEIDLQQKNVDLVQLRFDDGLVTYIDVTSANLQLESLKANALELIRQRGIFENAIAVLIGIPASEFCLSPMPLSLPPPVIPAGVPCSILSKRPDILAAEVSRAAKYALVESAYAAFLPSLTINGALGFYSPTLRDFMSWQSRLWQIGGMIAQTLFDGGRKASNVRAAWARFHELDGEYQKLVLNAFREVEDSLNNLDLQAKTYETLSRAVHFANETYSLSQERYDEGLVNYLEVLIYQTNQVTAEINAVGVLGASYLSTIQLIKALGGSWECGGLL